ARIVGARAGALLRHGTPAAGVLGCTHYPLIGDIFRAALPAATAILSQPGIVGESLADYLRRHPRFASAGTGGVTALTSGDPAAVSEGARRFDPAAPVFRAA
ncbi:MAG: glutamate racemase, partial [Thermohalobaculum sp.]|nr:glutamate racemase [Thermohalobaculum sp.]